MFLSLSEPCDAVRIGRIRLQHLHCCHPCHL
nr:MAG TPA: hypothetical protein [Caudoviricetes sp.]